MFKLERPILVLLLIALTGSLNNATSAECHEATQESGHCCYGGMMSTRYTDGTDCYTDNQCTSAMGNPCLAAPGSACPCAYCLPHEWGLTAADANSCYYDSGCSTPCGGVPELPKIVPPVFLIVMAAYAFHLRRQRNVTPIPH